MPEEKFQSIKKELQKLYTDANVPEIVRRKILEASSRAPEAWHQNATRAAYASGDPDWRLSAVYAMRSVDGFEAQIIESLGSDNPAVRYEAIMAAGNWQLEAAWPKITEILTSKNLAGNLMITAIEAVFAISNDLHDEEAIKILSDLANEYHDKKVADSAAFELEGLPGVHLKKR